MTVTEPPGTSLPSDSYRSPFADDPVLARWGRRAYWIVLVVFVLVDLLLLASAVVALWVSLTLGVGAELMFLRMVSK